MKPTVEYMEITPQMAREMLGKSKGNTMFVGGNAAVSANASALIQEAIYDYLHEVPRTRQYNSKKTIGRYFAANARMGDKRYLSMWGE